MFWPTDTSPGIYSLKYHNEGTLRPFPNSTTDSNFDLKFQRSMVEQEETKKFWIDICAR